MFRTPRFRATVAVAALSLFSLNAVQAQAHAKLVSANPSANSSVSSPQTILLKFSEAIAKKLSSMKLADAGGNPIAMMQMPAPDAKSLSIMPNATLPPGQYTVSWTAVSTDDGHKMTGAYHFTVK